MTSVSLKGPVILDIPADPPAMFIVRAVVEKISSRIGFGTEETDKLVLAVDEACTNVIRHAYKNSSDERIVITFRVVSGLALSLENRGATGEGGCDETGKSRDCFEIAIRDFGSGADPATFQGRDLNEIRPGGLGIHFIKSAADRVEYDTPPGGGMLLKLMKFMPGEEKAQN